MGITPTIGKTLMKYAEDECSCHICHKVMKIKLRYGQQPYVIGEWHICDTCMDKKYELDE